VEKASHGEKAGKPRQVADERLGLDLLLQVGFDVSAERLVAILGRENDRDRPEPQRRVEVEVAAELLGKKVERGGWRSRGYPVWVPASASFCAAI